MDEPAELFKLWLVAAFGARLYLIVSQSVESFPVIVDFRGDIFILQNDSGHPTLAPFFRKRNQTFTSSWPVTTAVYHTVYNMHAGTVLRLLPRSISEALGLCESGLPLYTASSSFSLT